MSTDKQEYLNKVIVDICKSKFYLISDQGNEKTVSCEDSDQFMNVLNYITSNLSEDRISYSNILN